MLHKLCKQSLYALIHLTSIRQKMICTELSDLNISLPLLYAQSHGISVTRNYFFLEFLFGVHPRTCFILRAQLETVYR
jgi:hypothetical protein